MSRVKEILDQTLVFAELATTSLSISGTAAAPVAMLLGKGIDLIQSALVTDEEVGQLAQWWAEHNAKNLPMTQEVLESKFDRAIEAARKRTRFRERFGLPPIPSSVQQLAMPDSKSDVDHSEDLGARIEADFNE